MKYMLLIIMICTVCSCQEKKVDLIYFRHYELDTLADTAFGILIEQQQQQEKEVIRVLFREGGYYPGEHIQGDFRVSNDTIFLTYKYFEKKDKLKGHHIAHSPVIAYEYHFITDTLYTYVYDSHVADSIRFPYYFQ